MHTVGGEMQYLTKTLASDWVKTFRGGKYKEEEENVCSVMQEAVGKINSPLFVHQGGNQGCVIKEAELAVADLAVFHLPNCTQDLQPAPGPCPE